MTDSSKEVNKMPYIYYLVWFGSQESVKDLFNSSSEFNAMSLGYAQKLGFRIRNTNVGAQKIDNSVLETFGMVIAETQVENKTNRPRFF